MTVFCRASDTPSIMPDILQFIPPENHLFRFIANDVKTAAYDAASICQVGLAFIRFDRPIETDSPYIDPCTPFAKGNTRLRGIGAKTVRDA